MRQAAIVLLVFTVSCSKASDVKCGAGTVLKDGVCVVDSKQQGSAPSPQPDAAATKPGENVNPPAADDPWNKSAAAPAAGSANGVQWVFTTEHDAMRNKDVHFARLLSTNTAEFNFPYAGGSHLGLILRKGDPRIGPRSRCARRHRKGPVRLRLRWMQRLDQVRRPQSRTVVDVSSSQRELAHALLQSRQPTSLEAKDRRS
jgi:hypothetical protein